VYSIPNNCWLHFETSVPSQ